MFMLMMPNCLPSLASPFSEPHSHTTFRYLSSPSSSPILNIWNDSWWKGDVEFLSSLTPVPNSPNLAKGQVYLVGLIRIFQDKFAAPLAPSITLFKSNFWVAVKWAEQVTNVPVASDEEIGEWMGLAYKQCKGTGELALVSGMGTKTAMVTRKW